MEEIIRQFIKSIIKVTPFYYPVRNLIIKGRDRKESVEWEKGGKSRPPPHVVKQNTLRFYSKNYKLRVLVETGTYLGDMVEAMKADFDQVYSIELSKEFYEKATKRFKGVKNLALIHGDSGIELGNVMKRINQPALFWLDGHYSGNQTAKGHKDTPIYEELEHIFKDQEHAHVILIDDARCFGTDSAYPSIGELTEFCRNKNANLEIVVQDDIIRITPGI